MSIDEKPPMAEREETDESLRLERERTDLALSDAEHAIAESAERVVQRARDTADAVVDQARDKEDEERAHVRAPAQPAALARERRQEDEALRGARATADDTLRAERDEGFSALAELLPLEREKTDRYLLTERARSDDAVANRDDFLSIVSHDLRNLLNGIVLSSALLSTHSLRGERGRRSREGAERIRRYAARMNRLIGDLLDVASIDAGRLSVTMTGGDASALLGEVAEMFGAAAQAKGVRLATDVTERPLLAELDHDRILQVLANLLSNAIKFTSPGGQIRLRGERDADGILLSVSDDGSGVPEDALEAIFERFRQVGEDDRRGTGLGLYISRCIVEAHGGRIWAESTLGEGSTFRFRLTAVAR